MKQHMNYYLQYNQPKAFIEMRKFLASYLKGFDNVKELRQLAVTVNNLNDFNNLLKKLRHELVS
jgi:tRNA-dihydrouridine synthase